ncbi:MAG: PLP-dependent aminotransferase family protein [Halanaerobiales bacterium]
MLEEKLASRVGEMENGELAGLMSLIARDDIISFAGGIPDEYVFPHNELCELTEQLFEDFGCKVFQYSSTDGSLELKEYLVEFLSKRGVMTSSDELIITTGSQQGLDLVSKIFIDPGDVVFVEKPGYVGGIGAFKSYQADVIGINMLEDGIDIEQLEMELKRCTQQEKNVKFIYLVPDYSNPSGIQLSLQKRKRVLELAEEYDFYILEDTPYSELGYFEERLPYIKELDDNNRVILMGTFSKFFIPGMRVAWISAEDRVIDILCRAKQNTDLASNNYGQILLAEAGKVGLMEKQLENVIPYYRKRLEAMGNALGKYMPGGTSWADTRGGFFYWLKLPEDVTGRELFKRAIKEKVAFVTGNSFFPVDSDGDNYIRLSFSKTPVDDIDEGIKRLAGLIKEEF